MCRCKDMPECKTADCSRRSDCDTGGFCYEHDPFAWYESPGDVSYPAPEHVEVLYTSDGHRA